MSGKITLLIVLIFACLTGFGQQCDCKTDFLFVRQFMERNHPGFNSDIKSVSEPAYNRFVTDLEKEMEKDKEGRYCIAFLKKYMLYLKDHHSNIDESSLPIAEKNPDSLAAFFQSDRFKNTERVAIDSITILKKLQKSRDPVEGIYITSDTTYTVAVIKDPRNNKEYKGVILSSRTPLWQKGQVKLRIKESSDGYREGYFFLRNHSLSFSRWRPEPEASPIEGWTRIYPTMVNRPKTMLSTELISFKVLDSQTAYLAIRSFGGQFGKTLDSAYKVIIPQIKQFENLIIDVRGNGGGSDANYNALMPLIYSDTIENDYVELFVTEDNRKAYQDMRDYAKAHPEQWGQRGYMSWEYRLNQMKNIPVNTFIPISPKGTKSTYKKEELPKKIAILYDRQCASSCEQLILDALFSRKVVLTGENSGGYIAYGNVMSIQTPCGRTLRWTTTRKNRDRQFEFVGIPPQIKIPVSEPDWIQYTHQQLKNR